MAYYFLIVGLLFTTCSFIAFATDPGPLQDFCVADLNSSVRVNGFACKDPNMVTADDFLFRGLDKRGNTTNAFGSRVTNVNVFNLPGTNTLGISVARIDYAPKGLNTPHIHPRATELLTVLEGHLIVGFVATNPENRLFLKRVKKGDCFVFPRGMIHFQQNVGNSHAVALSSLNSQNPGVLSMGNGIFGSNPGIPDNILEKAFQVNKSVIDEIQSNF